VLGPLNDTVSSPNPLEAAYLEMERLIDSGADSCCEQVIQSFALQDNSEATLELIYLEFVLRRERGQPLSVQHFRLRFPQFDQLLSSLFGVDSVISDSSTAIADCGQSAHEHFFQPIDPLDRLAGRMCGQYILEKVIGQGGMGVVYLARQVKLGRSVAIKLLNSLSGLDETSRQRFLSEASVVSKLQHPNIVQVYEIGSAGQEQFFSMELVAGGSLADYLQGSTVSARLAAKLVNVLSRTIAYAHAQGIVHRDLKPANILLAPSDRPEALQLDRPIARDLLGKSLDIITIEPKIADFGLAKQLRSTDELTANGALLGTPSFMAPEQVTASDVDIGPACDQYALGAVLYTALVGRPPFLASNTHETIRQVREEDPPALRQLQRHVPRDLETICLRCLRKDPAARYPSATHLADDLQRFLDGVPIHARPIGLIEKSRKWVRRNPSLASLAVSIVIALISTTWLWRTSEISRTATQAARAEAENLLYARDIAMIHSQLRMNHISIDTARRKLAQTKPKDRGWEWQYLSTLVDQAIWESPASSQAVTTAALSPDGRLAAIGHGQWGFNRPQNIEVWDTIENKLLWELQGHPDCQISCVQFSPDGNWLVSSGIVWHESSQVAGVLLWDLATGEKKLVADVNAYVIRFLPNNSTLLIGQTDGLVTSYSIPQAEKQPQVFKLNGMILDICLALNGSTMAASSRGGSLTVVDMKQHKQQHTFTNQGDIRKLSWDYSSSRLRVGGFEGDVREFHVTPEQMKLVHVEHHAKLPYISASPDGNWHALAVFGQDTLLCNQRSGKAEHMLNGHGGHVRAVNFDSTCRKLITGGNDGVVRVWDLTRPNSARTEGLIDWGAQGRALAFHPQKSQIAIGTAVNPTLQMKSSGGQIEIINSESLRRYKRFKAHTDDVNSVDYSTDGKHLISASSDKSVKIWEASNASLQVELIGHESAVLQAKFDAHPARAISLDADGMAIVWNTQSAQIVQRFNCKCRVTAGAISTPTKLIAIADDSGRLLLWDYEKAEQVAQWDAGTTNITLAFDRTGHYLAVGGFRPEIDLWEVESLKQAGISSRSRPKPTRRLIGSLNKTSHFDFSPDGQRMFVVGRDEKIHLYDTSLGNELLTLEAEKGTDQNRIGFSPDGSKVVCCSGNRTMAWTARPKRRNDQQSGLDKSSDALIQWHETRMKTLRVSQKFHSAIYHCSNLIALQPDNKLRLCQRAQLKNNIQDYDGAIEDFEAGLPLISDPMWRSEYAKTLLRQGKLSEYKQQCILLTMSANFSARNALASIARTVSLCPETAGLSSNLLPIVKAELTRELEPGLQTTQSLLLLRMGQFDKAIQATPLKSKEAINYLVVSLAMVLKTKAQFAASGQTGDGWKLGLPSNAKVYRERFERWYGNELKRSNIGDKMMADWFRDREDIYLLYQELLREWDGDSL
jgi:eukaryotic-like serine/threonine-protein kinase